MLLFFAISFYSFNDRFIILIFSEKKVKGIFIKYFTVDLN